MGDRSCFQVVNIYVRGTFSPGRPMLPEEEPSEEDSSVCTEGSSPKQAPLSVTPPSTGELLHVRPKDKKMKTKIHKTELWLTMESPWLPYL